jgi:hypothetical protein
MPVTMPTSGIAASFVMISRKKSDSARGETALVMARRPENRMPKPISTRPDRPFPSRLIKYQKNDADEERDGRQRGRLEKLKDRVAVVSRSMSLMIWAVTVVPMVRAHHDVAACLSVRRPAAMRPTVSTMVADDA